MLALTWMSCGGPSADMVPTVYEETRVEGAVERTVAQMSVQGMMCEVGCVAKVRQVGALRALPDVLCVLVRQDHCVVP